MSTAKFIKPDTTCWPRHWRRPTAADLQLLQAGYHRGLVPAHADILGRRTPPVAPGSAEAIQAAEALFDAARRQEREGGGAFAGLAAPQIGIAASALLFDPRPAPTDGARADQLVCVINATVHPTGPADSRDVEGCLSTGRIRGWVHRAERVRLTGYTPAGDPIDQTHTGTAARVLQHESDHLAGILFPDRVEHDSDLLWVSLEQHDNFLTYVRAVRRGQQPPAWAPLTPRDQWNAIGAGVPVFGHLQHTTTGGHRGQA